MLVDGRARLGQPVRHRGSSCAGADCARGARQWTVRLPREAREPSRGRALERRLHRRAGSLGLPRGTIRATVLIETITAPFEMEEILYALREHVGRAQRGSLGLHLQRDQEVPRRPDVRAARPLGRDDGRALHARLHRAARARLPPPRRARDRRHGGVHPESRRRRSTSRRSRRCARTRSARPARASTAPGSRTPVSCRSRARSSTRCSATGPTRSRGCARTSCPTAPRCSPSTGRRRDHARGRADERHGRPALPRLVARRGRCGGHRQPHGGRGHG